MEAIFFVYIFFGALVGLAVGITGVGGGSLMTPILLMLGFPPNVAIGTDLLYAAITKSGGIISHQQQKNIDWSIVITLGLGSVPAAILTSLALSFWFADASEYSVVLTSALGVMLVLTSIVLFFRQTLYQKAQSDTGIMVFVSKHNRPITIAMGALLGIFVTLSSVGAGAIGAAILFLLYPYLHTRTIVGSDIAHAVPLTFIAGFAHLLLGNVDFILLAGLLIGSLPAIHVGAKLSRHIPNRILQPILASLLMALGLKFFFVS